MYNTIFKKFFFCSSAENVSILFFFFQVAKTIDNNAQNASPNPPSSEMISQAFNNLLSNMQMSEMNNQQTFDAIPIPPQTNQETVATLQPSIPNPSMSLSTTLTTTLTMLQPSTLNSVMNQSAVVLMPPPSNSIPNTIINQQQALSGVLMQFPTSTPTPIMDQQTTMGRLLQFSNSSSVPPVAMGQVMQHHLNSISTNNQVLAVTQAPPSSTTMNRQQIGLMLPPAPVPANHQQDMFATSSSNSFPLVMAPNSVPSSTLIQQMRAQLPQELKGEDISVLLAKTYEQDCIRRSARSLGARVPQFDAVNTNPLLASSNISK